MTPSSGDNIISIQLECYLIWPEPDLWLAAVLFDLTKYWSLIGWNSLHAHNAQLSWTTCKLRQNVFNRKTLNIEIKVLNNKADRRAREELIRHFVEFPVLADLTHDATSMEDYICMMTRNRNQTDNWEGECVSDYIILEHNNILQIDQSY